MIYAADTVRANKPRIHCITNYVTANDCANILLAAGASPIMADAPEEAGEITALCNGLLLNLGTLHTMKLESMRIAGKTANRLAIPVILDPVGVGASAFRMQSALQLLHEIHFSVIRGNLSEIKSLASGIVNHQNGIDAAASDNLTDTCLEQIAVLARDFAQKTSAVIVITGNTDIIASTEKVYGINNGCSIMKNITGAGCMLSALTAAFASVAECMIENIVSAVGVMGICGEIAQERISCTDGNASYRNYLIDAVYNLTKEKFYQKAACKILLSEKAS